MINLSFSVTPVAKGRPQFSKAGHCYTPTKTSLFEKEIRILAAQQMRLNSFRILTGPITAVVTFYIKKPQKLTRQFPATKPDLDNLIKGVFDALNGIAWDDDAQVCRIECEKVYGEPRILLTAYEYQGVKHATSDCLSGSITIG